MDHHTRLTPDAQRRLLLQAMPLLLAGPAAALAAPATPQPQRQPPPQSRGGARSVSARMQALRQLEALEREADAARYAAESLAVALRAVHERRQRGGAALDPVRAALHSIDQQSLPLLDQGLADWRSARQAADEAVAMHLAAVQALLQAPPAGRAAAMDRLDASAERRRRAEDAEDAARRPLDEALAGAGRTVSALGAHWEALAQPTAANQAALRSAAQDWAALQRRWRDLRSAMQAAGVHSAAWPALPPAAPWRLPPLPPMPPAPDRALLQPWPPALAASQAATHALRLLADARAAVQQALAEGRCGTDPAGPGCGAWQADGVRLHDEDRRQQAALAAAEAVQARSQAALRDLPARTGDTLQTLLAWRSSLDAAVDAASGPALRRLQAAMAASATARNRLAEARRRAEDALRVELAAQREQQRLRSAAEAEMRIEAPGAGRPSPAAGMQIAIRSHALHRLHQRGDEPTGFSAYTYVLVGAGVTATTPGVQARLQRLLDAVRNLPVASAVHSDERAGLNTFVVPVPADNGEHDPLVVHLPLAQSLLTHLPPALRLADATRRRLYVDNGPFLITLPGRLAEARADWPLLFADLSRTPEPVVADVARRYMADLIGSFNPASTDWSPPAGMQVAITLVRLVKGSGDVAQAVFGGFGR